MITGHLAVSIHCFVLSLIDKHRIPVKEKYSPQSYVWRGETSGSHRAFVQTRGLTGQ